MNRFVYEITDFNETVKEYFRAASGGYEIDLDPHDPEYIEKAVKHLKDHYDNCDGLRIFSWNCNGKKNGLTVEKMQLIKKFRPMIIILQECTYCDCLKFNNEYKNIVWYGDGKDSQLGIGMFSNTFRFKLLPSHSYDAPFRYVVPYSVEKDDLHFTLFSVWAKKHISTKSDNGKEQPDSLHNLDYADNIISAVDYYADLFKDKVIFIGDFNSADLPQKRSPEHLRVIEKLTAHNVYNWAKLPDVIYDGDYEFLPTFFQNYDRNKAYANDYCFMTNDIYNITVGVFFVGVPEKWLDYSDHVPIMLDINIRTQESK
jgi:exonuclease III